MLCYFLRRTLNMVPAFFITTFLLFAVIRIIPGDPAQAQFGERRIPEELRQSYAERYHLDESIPRQYVRYMADVFTLDLGESVASQRPISEIFREALPRTASLASLALLFVTVSAVPLGILAARRKGSALDNVFLFGSLVLLAVPPFVLGLAAQLFVAVRWEFFPVSGAEHGLRSYLLPALVIAASMLAINARLMRTSLVDATGADYLQTARAKGMSEGRVFRVHALRNAILPLLTMLAINFGHLLGGTIVIESVFNIPGIGYRVTRAIAQRDTTMITGISVFLVLVCLVINLMVDLFYAWLDPRVRHEG